MVNQDIHAHSEIATFPGPAEDQVEKITAFPGLAERLVALDMELDIEDDGRHIAEIVALPGCIVYGATREAAILRAQILALRVIADCLEHGESIFDESFNEQQMAGS
jgi:predicted RNase H-like HicB family nuclease